VVETKKPPVDGFVRRDLPGCVVCPAACHAAAAPAVRPVRQVTSCAAPRAWCWRRPTGNPAVAAWST